MKPFPIFSAQTDQINRAFDMQRLANLFISKARVENLNLVCSVGGVNLIRMVKKQNRLKAEKQKSVNFHKLIDKISISINITKKRIKNLH